MAGSYSGDPTASELDAVRDKIGDTDDSAWQLSDEEIQSEIDGSGGSVLMAASRCARKIAARYSRKVTKSIGRTSINYSDLAKQYFALATELEDEAKSGGSYVAAPSSGTDNVENTFGRGMMSNHEGSDELD